MHQRSEIPTIAEIPTIYQNFTAMIHSQFNAKIKTFRADCARRYSSLR